MKRLILFAVWRQCLRRHARVGARGERRAADPVAADRAAAAAIATGRLRRARPGGWWVSRAACSVPTDPTKRRVACTTCPVTMDYRPDRLNIFFDAETGIIKEVKCG